MFYNRNPNVLERFCNDLGSRNVSIVLPVEISAPCFNSDRTVVEDQGGLTRPSAYNELVTESQHSQNNP